MSRPVKIREARDRGNPVGVAVEWGLHNSRRNRELQGELGRHACSAAEPICGSVIPIAAVGVPASV